MAEHIVAVFRTNEGALAATQDLKTAGIPASAIRQYTSNASGEQQVEPTAYTSTTHQSGGFWSWLFGEDSESTHSTTDADAYNRTTAAGNVVLSVTVDDDAKIHQAIMALEAHHPVDIDERSDETDASELTSGTPVHSTVGTEYSSGAVAQADPRYTAPTAETVGSGAGRVGPVGTTATSSTAAADASLGTTASSREEVIPLAEEQLEVGKRTVDRGTTRIRRYVVEKPVEETVTLRGEKVTVERRQPIGTSASAGVPGAGAFEERVVEVRETAQEPVVSKTAHIAEEVVVGREATERTETVRDTVRREEVEINSAVNGQR